VDPQVRRRARMGLLFMFLATLCFLVMSAFVKILRQDGMGTAEVMVWRMAPGIPVVWLELRLRGHKLRPKAPAVLALRSLFGLMAMAGYFYALRALTMIENAVLFLLQPVFVAVLSPVVLDERLRRSALLALVIALAGALLAIRPDRALRLDLPLLPFMLGTLAALCSSGAHMLVRKATAKDAPELVVFWFTVSASAAAVALALAVGELQGLPAGLGLGEAALKIGAMAGCGLGGQLLMTRAYGRASAPVVAMISYANIPLSVLVDLLVWGLTPGLDAVIGSLLTIGAGLLLLRR